MRALLITIGFAALALGSNAQINLPRLWQIGGSTDYITQIALSPDKRYLASCDHSGFVRLWRLDDLQLLWARHIGGSVNAIQISPDGRWIVCTTTSRTPPLAGASGLLLRIADGEVIRNLLGGFRFAFSPDGQLLAYSDRNRLRVLRLTDEAVLFQTPHPFGFEQGDVLFVPNTDLVCLHGWSDSERATLLKVWNWRTGALVHEARFPNASPGRLAVPADGRYLAAGLVYYSDDCYIALEVVILQPHAQWRVATRLTHDRTGGQMYMRCSISLSEYLALDFSPDGRMLAVGGAYISLWDTRTWTNLRALGIPGAVGTPGTFATALRFRDSQTLVAGYSDGRLLQWRIERDPVRLLRKRLGSLVFSAAISADGQIGAFGDSNRAIEVWNLAQGRRLWLRTVPPDRGSSVALTRQGDRVACSGVEGIEVRDALTGALIEVIPLQGAPLTFDPEGNRLVVAQNEGVDSLLLVWDLVNRRTERIIGRYDSYVLNARFSADGRYLLFENRLGVFVYDWDTEQATYYNAPFVSAGFALTPNNDYLVLGGLTFWSLTDDRFWSVGRTRVGAGAALSEEEWAIFNFGAFGTGNAVGAYHLSDARLRWWERTPRLATLAFTPDGRGVLAASDIAVAAIDLTAQAFPEPISALSRAVKQLEPLSEGALCLANATNMGGTDLITFDLRSGQILQFREFHGSRAAVDSMELTNRFGIAFEGLTIQWWSALGWSPEYTYSATSRIPHSVWFTAGDRYFLVKSDGGFEVWDTREQMRVQARAARSCFTPQSGAWLVTMEDDTLKMRRLPRGELIRYLYVTSGDVLQLAPSGRFLIVQDSPPSNLMRLDLSPERVVWRLPNVTYYNCLIDPQERYFVGIDSTQMVVHRVADGARLFTLPYNQWRRPVELTLSPDGDLIAALYNDGVVEFFNPFTGLRVARYQDEAGGSHSGCLRFTRDGRYLLFGRFDGTVLAIPDPRYYLQGDIDGDGCIGDTDLLRVLFRFGDAFAFMPEDLNRDGRVDDADLLLVLMRFGQGCANS